VPTSSERKALWFLAVVALSGGSVRMWRASRPNAEPEAVAALDRQLGRVDSVRENPRPRRGTSKAAKPRARDGAAPAVSGAAGPIDLDRADSAAIESLPGIGPALAARIIANRDSAGPFGSIEALCDVRGIGPAMAGKLRSLVTFTGPRRPLSDACGTASARARKTSSARGRETP
jgi:competence protein ComEA